MAHSPRREAACVAAIIGAFCLAAWNADAAGGWNASRLQSVFSRVPAAPSSLAEAGGMIGPVKDKHGNAALGPTGALAKSRADFHAGVAAANAMAAAQFGVDSARLRNDPAYAKQFQQKMASMSQAEKIQMAMKMSGAAQAPNPDALRAFGSLETYVVGDGAKATTAARNTMRGGMTKIAAHYNSCHANLDKNLAAALKACPMVKRCGDTTDCPPVPACIATIQARVPELIAQHRKCALSELNEERGLFGKTRAAMAPVVGKITALTAAAEKAGVSGTQRNAGYNALLADIAQLQLWDAQIALRAGYWQNIKPKKVADDFFVVGNLGYSYPLGQNDITRPPDDVPDGW
jgi:hypothetical protein